MDKLTRLLIGMIFLFLSVIVYDRLFEVIFGSMSAAQISLVTIDWLRGISTEGRKELLSVIYPVGIYFSAASIVGSRIIEFQLETLGIHLSVFPIVTYIGLVVLLGLGAIFFTLRVRRSLSK